MAHPTTLLDAQRIAVRPVHEAAEVIPLVDASYLHPVAHPERRAFGEVEVVRDEQGLPVAYVDDETLVALLTDVVGQEPPDLALDFDPAAVVLLRQLDGQPAVSGTIVISTRRFACRPAGVLLSAIGRDSPMPTVISRSPRTPRPRR